MLKVVLIGTVLISYIGILYSVSKEQPKPKLFIFFFWIIVLIVLCIEGIEIYIMLIIFQILLDLKDMII